MYQEKFVEIFSKHRSKLTPEIAGILRQQLPSLPAKKIERLLRGTLKILELYPALSEENLEAEARHVLHDIIREEYVEDLKLEDVLRVKIAIRDWAFNLLLQGLLADKVDQADVLQFTEWRNRVSRNLSLHLIAFYEKTYQTRIHSLDDNYKSLLNRIHDLVLVVGTNGALAYANQKVLGFLGYSKKQLAKKNFFEILHPGDLDVFKKLFQNCPKEGAFLDLRILNHENQTKIIGFMIVRNGKRWGGVALECVGHDLSNNMLLEAKLDDRYQRMQEAYIELGRVNRQVIFLSDLCSLFASFDDHNERVNYVLYVIAQLLAADTVIFRELDPDKKCLVFRNAYKYEEEWKEIRFNKDQKHLSWQTVLQYKKHYIPDIPRDQEHNYYGITKRCNFNSIITFPVILAGKVLGVISALAHKTDAFSEHPAEILEAVINQFALLWELRRLKLNK